MSDSQFHIRFAVSLSIDERRILLGWSDDPYGINHLRLTGRPKAHHFLGDEDGQVVSHVGLLKDVVHVAGKPITIGGIGGVVTVPAARGKGYAHALLQCAADYMCTKMQVEFGMLFCLPRLMPFYQSAGWVDMKSPVWVEQPQGRIASPVNVMVLRCASDRDWPEGDVEAGMLW